MDQELRDRVQDSDVEELSELSAQDEDDFKKNTDLTYYGMMNPDEKILTLTNRAKLLEQRHHEMM